MEQLHNNENVETQDICKGAMCMDHYYNNMCVLCCVVTMQLCYATVYDYECVEHML